MTAVGMLCRQYLGVNPRNPGLLKRRGLPQGHAGPGKTRQHLLRVLRHAGDAPHGRRRLGRLEQGSGGDGKGGIRDTLIAKQDKDRATFDAAAAAEAGPPGRQLGRRTAPALNDGGRIMYTSLSLLTLEVYYRHLPLYRKDMGVNKETEMNDAPKEAPK